MPTIVIQQRSSRHTLANEPGRKVHIFHSYLPCKTDKTVELLTL